MICSNFWSSKNRIMLFNERSLVVHDKTNVFTATYLLGACQFFQANTTIFTQNPWLARSCHVSVKELPHAFEEIAIQNVCSCHVSQRTFVCCWGPKNTLYMGPKNILYIKNKIKEWEFPSTGKLGQELSHVNRFVHILPP